MSDNPESRILPSDDRYARHRLIAGWDQERLAAARVLVAGAGALGNEVIKLLALLGVGNILIVDFDHIAISNLTRCVLFRDADIGKSKALVAAERARELNPDIGTQAFTGDLEYDIGLGIYRSMDVVIGCLDSIHARLALNRACYRAGIPWLNGGIEATVGEAALFQSGNGACFECAMSPTLWNQEMQRHSCSGLPRNLAEKTMPTTAILASLVASYLVNEALTLLHSTPEKPRCSLEAGQKLYLMLQPYGFSVQKLPVNDECLAHEVWEPVEIWPVSPQEGRASDLLRWLDAPNGAVELGYDLLIEMRCVECDDRETILRPVEKCCADLIFCPRCGVAGRQAEVISYLEADSELACRPFADLGLPDYAVMAVRTEMGRRYIQLTGEWY
jgi:adenylyltransferase/sulfurtransferase